MQETQDKILEDVPLTITSTVTDIETEVIPTRAQ